MATRGPRPLVEVVRLGLLPYREALRVQEAYVRRCQAGGGGGGASHALLLCQHPPVYTTGIRQKGRPPAELERLRLLGAQVHNVDRGGLITFHGPGQLLCYPVLHLAAFKKVRPLAVSLFPDAGGGLLSVLSDGITICCGAFKSNRTKCPICSDCRNI